jgi:uncharacterized protein with FMN-binding domain
MSKPNLLLLATALGIFGTAVIAGHPDWGTFTGIAFLLLAGGVFAGALPLRFDEEIVEQRGPSQKISNGLIGLSSAAILAVYIAGYHRTGAAENGFAAQAARRGAPAPIVATAVAPKTAILEFQATPAARPSPAPPVKKPRASSTPVPEAVPPPAASGDSPASPFAPPAVRPPDDRPVEPAAPVVRTPPGRYKDGTYSGWGSSRHGDIQASVVIQDGQIVSAEIARCLTRYPCSWIIHLPNQVVSKQSTQVNYVSGATESSEAFFDAVAQALTQASE